MTKAEPLPCPVCGEDVYVLKKNRCPNEFCATELHRVNSKKYRGLITMEEKSLCNDLVLELGELIGQRDCVEIDGRYFFPKERRFLYELLVRARSFLRAQKRDLGWTAATFLRDLIRYVLEDTWWRSHIKSYLMLVNRIQEFAIDLYRRRTQAIEMSESAAMTFVDYGGYVQAHG